MRIFCTLNRAYQTLTEKQTGSLGRFTQSDDIRLHREISAARFPTGRQPAADILHRSYLVRRAISCFIAFFRFLGTLLQ